MGDLSRQFLEASGHCRGVSVRDGGDSFAYAARAVPRADCAADAGGRRGQPRSPSAPETARGQERRRVGAPHAAFARERAVCQLPDAFGAGGRGGVCGGQHGAFEHRSGEPEAGI